MCGIQKAAGGVLEAILSMAAGKGADGVPQSMQESFRVLMQKAGALQEHCAAGDLDRAPPVDPGVQHGDGPGGQPRGGGPAPVQAWMLPTSPKRAREQSDADPCQTRSESEQEAAAAERVENNPIGGGGLGAALEPDGQPLEEREVEDLEGDKEMADEDGFSEARGRRRGRSRRASAKAKLDPEKKGASRGTSKARGRSSQPDLRDFLQGRVAQRAAVEPAPGSKEAKKAAKEAVKQAAKDRAKVKKQAKR